MKITSFRIKPKEEASSTAIEMHESVPRPESLVGMTYKVKTPVQDHSMYITINDIILNQGTDQEERRPFEIFINSKNMDNFQWVVALTRVISAVFRKGGDITFLVEELRAVFDPKGGYFKRGGLFMPSLVAEIGLTIETHMQAIGLMQKPVLDKHQQDYIDSKQQTEETGYPANATVCPKCSTKAAVIMDGCSTCLSCGDSKCG